MKAATASTSRSNSIIRALVVLCRLWWSFPATTPLVGKPWSIHLGRGFFLIRDKVSVIAGVVLNTQMLMYRGDGLPPITVPPKGT